MLTSQGDWEEARVEEGVEMVKVVLAVAEGVVVTGGQGGMEMAMVAETVVREEVEVGLKGGVVPAVMEKAVAATAAATVVEEKAVRAKALAVRVAAAVMVMVMVGKEVVKAVVDEVEADCEALDRKRSGKVGGQAISQLSAEKSHWNLGRICWLR